MKYIIRDPDGNNPVELESHREGDQVHTLITQLESTALIIDDANREPGNFRLTRMGLRVFQQAKSELETVQ